jgi:hypothetical protein
VAAIRCIYMTNFAMHFCHAFLQCIFLKRFCNAFSQCVFTMRFRIVFWQRVLAMRFGNAFVHYFSLSLATLWRLFRGQDNCTELKREAKLQC